MNPIIFSRVNGIIQSACFAADVLVEVTKIETRPKISVHAKAAQASLHNAREQATEVDWDRVQVSLIHASRSLSEVVATSPYVYERRKVVVALREISEAVGLLAAHLTLVNR